MNQTRATTSKPQDFKPSVASPQEKRSVNGKIGLLLGAGDKTGSMLQINGRGGTASLSVHPEGDAELKLQGEEKDNFARMKVDASGAGKIEISKFHGKSWSAP